MAAVIDTHAELAMSERADWDQEPDAPMYGYRRSRSAWAQQKDTSDVHGSDTDYTAFCSFASNTFISLIPFAFVAGDRFHSRLIRHASSISIRPTSTLIHAILHLPM